MATSEWVPPPRLVDASLLVAVGVLLATGIGGLVAGRPSQWWVVAAHGSAGLALGPLLALKLYRVRHRILSGSASVALSVLLAGVTIAALGTGIAWTLGAGIRVGPFLPLVVHGLLGIAIVPLLVVHLRRRFRLPARDSLADRRRALQYAGLVASGAVAWRAQEAVNRVRAVAPRRFTGSRETGSDAGNAFPVTSWVADDPDPIDRDGWTLTVDGAVERPRTFTYDQLIVADGDGGRHGAEADAPDGSPGTLGRATDRALLDCTSGWYSTHEWQGVPGRSLLDAAGVATDGRWVTFHSVTGYRWSLPIEEARQALLATHVDGERLSHGHGSPLRLVAPDRRGFQWVKWVDRVQVRRRRDFGELVAIFVSGFRSAGARD